MYENGVAHLNETNNAATPFFLAEISSLEDEVDDGIFKRTGNCLISADEVDRAVGALGSVRCPTRSSSMMHTLR